MTDKKFYKEKKFEEKKCRERFLAAKDISRKESRE
jgi:hypothetical protein